MTPRYYDQGSFSAALYDLIDGALCPESELTFYRTLAIGAKTPILDIGAGTGRLSFPLSEAGHSVLGVDLSADMLAVAKKKLEGASDEVRSRLNFRQSDMRYLKLDQTYDLAIVPYRGFNFLLTEDDQSLFLRALHRHLSDTGRAVLDTWGAPDGTNTMRSTSPHRRTVVNLDGSRFNVARTFKSERIDESRQTATFTVTYEIMDKAGNVLRSKEEDLTLHWTTPDRMKALIEQHNFQLVAELGGFDAKPAAGLGDRLWVIERAV